MIGRYQSVIVWAVGVGLTVLFWSDLWSGYGLIGGDLYPYFFPQKVFYAEQLAEGQIPVWNDRVGFGYPVLGESQTGALYPSNLVLYRLFDVNTAYNVSQLLHYVLTFVAAAWWMRILGVNRWAALFGAGVYTYGWFPSRICLEWAILGGPYLPFGLAVIERFWQTHNRRWLIALALALTCHLLAGHYNIAFIECVVWATYATWRTFTGGDTATDDESRWRRPALTALALGVGFALASYPLADTYALKKQSQREGETNVFAAGYGHIPPMYLSQVILPWHWYFDNDDGDTDTRLRRLGYAVTADTNKIEAHLYFGLIPLALAVWWLVTGGWHRDRRDVGLLVIAVLATVYATGALVPWMQSLPGFGYFMGPGRWGIVVTLVVALWAAKSFESLLASRRRSVVVGVSAVVTLLTLADLGLVSALVTHSRTVSQAPVSYLHYSTVKKFFDNERQVQGFRPRVYGPGQNVLTLLGVSQWPTYLGLGPSVYWDAMPERPEGNTAPFYSDEQRTWLADSAVTHVLTFEPVDAGRWRLQPAFAGVDPLLNAVWGRRLDENVFVYRVPDAQPTVRGEDETAVAVDGSRPGELTISLKDGSAARPLTVGPLFHSGWVGDETLSRQDALYLTLGEGAKDVRLHYQPAQGYRLAVWVAMAAALGILVWFVAVPGPTVATSDPEADKVRR